MTYKSYLLRARELQEFFTNTYVEQVIEDAINSKNDELLRIIVRQYENEMWMMQDAEQALEDKILETANEVKAELSTPDGVPTRYMRDGDWEHDEERDNELSHRGEE